jgi:Leucine-rich repeat (LRR) protein
VETPGAAGALAQGLQRRRQLRELDVSDNGLSVNGARMLCAVLATCELLVVLSLAGNPIGAQGVAAAATLDLGACEAGAGGTAALAAALAYCPKLTSLNFEQNAIGAAGAAVLAQALGGGGGGGDGRIDGGGSFRVRADGQSRLALQVLTLHGNAIGDDGTALLLEGVGVGAGGSALAQLTSLDLGANELSAVGAGAW